MKTKKTILDVIINDLLNIFAALILVTSTPVLAAERCYELFQRETARPTASSEKNLRRFEQIFTRSRGLNSYYSALGDQFKAQIEKISTQGGHWIDSGGGDGVAVRQFISQAVAKATASIVTLESSAQPQERLSIYKGRFLEEIPNSEFQKAKLITDVFGPLAYSGAPDLILKKYFDLLDSKGEIYIFLGSQYENYGKRNRVVTADGRYLTFSEWIQSIPGIKSELKIDRFEDDGTIFEKWSMKLTKDSKAGALSIPKLELVDLKEGAPPEMFFKETRTNLSESKLEETRQVLQSTIQSINKDFTFSNFIDSFRSGQFFHPLLSSISRLRTNDLWINLSNFGDQLNQNFKSNVYDAQKTDIFIKLAQKWIRWRVGRVNPDRFEYSYLQNLETFNDKNSVQLITDLNGDFLTSLSPDKTLQKYLDITTKDAEIFINLGKEYTGLGAASVILKKDGSYESLRKWLLNLKGLRVQFYRGGYAWAGGQWTFVKITKTSSAAQIPSLKFIAASDLNKGTTVGLVFEEF